MFDSLRRYPRILRRSGCTTARGRKPRRARPQSARPHAGCSIARGALTPPCTRARSQAEKARRSFHACRAARRPSCAASDGELARRRVVAEQHVRDPVALGARQPRGDHGRRPVEHAAEDQGRPESTIDDGGHAGRDHAFHELEVVDASSASRRDRRRLRRTVPRRRRRPRHRRVRAAAAVEYDTRVPLSTAAPTAARIVVPVVTAAGRALPFDRPAAALAADVVGALARDVNPLRALGERQHVVGILKRRANRGRLGAPRPMPARAELSRRVRDRRA